MWLTVPEKMKFIIKHESKGRIRIHAVQYRMSYEQADTLLYYLHSQKEVTFAKVYDRTCDATISYAGDRERIIELLRHFHYESAEVPTGLIENSGRELNNTYQEKLIGKIVFHYARRLILPYPIRMCLTGIRSVKYLWKGLKTLAAGKIEAGDDLIEVFVCERTGQLAGENCNGVMEYFKRGQEPQTFCNGDHSQTGMFDDGGGENGFDEDGTPLGDTDSVPVQTDAPSDTGNSTFDSLQPGDYLPSQSSAE